MIRWKLTKFEYHNITFRLTICFYKFCRKTPFKGSHAAELWSKENSCSMQAVSSLFNFLWRENYRVPLKDAGKLAQSPHWYEGGGGGMTSCILSMWKVLLVTNLRLGCDLVSCRPTAITMITLLTTFAFNSRFETLDVDNIRKWIFPLLWILNILKYHNVIHISSPVMPTLPLLAGDLRFFASSPTLPLSCFAT